MTLVIEKGGRRGAAALLAAATLLAASPACAGSFQVNPVNVALAPDKGSTELSLVNADAASVSVRVTALRWTQKDGADVYEPTRDVIASPPIFTVAPGARQLIRIGLRSRVPGTAYRLIVEEIPGPPVEGSGIKVALKLNLPFYVLSPGRAGATLSWTAHRGANGELFAQARNGGAQHAQVLGLEARDGAGRAIGGSKAMGVVLPMSARRWSLGAAKSAPAELIVKTAQGETRSIVRVEQP